MDCYLTLQTFLVGYSLSIADIAVWSGLAGSILTYVHYFPLNNHVIAVFIACSES